MNALVIAGQQLGYGVQVLQGVVGGHVPVGEFFERAIKPFGHGRFGFPLGGIVVNAIVVQQPFHVLVVKLFTLIDLQLDATHRARSSPVYSSSPPPRHTCSKRR